MMRRQKQAFFLLVLAVGTVNSQFGEIASVVTGLLPAVLGPGVSGAAGAASAAGAGASGALGGISTLYQLAQTALSLTGTGVGIINQASESSWFPAAVEHAVKANRDFQERALAGNSGGGGGGGSGIEGTPFAGLGSGLFPLPGAVGTANKGSGSIGTEYGKNFETEDSDEAGTEEETGTEELVSNKSPDLTKELAALEKEEKKASVEAPEPSTNSETDEFGRPVAPLPTPAAQFAAKPPRVTVEIPAKFRKSDVKDYEELLGKAYSGGTEADFEENNDGNSQSVPQLSKLIRDLQESNLSKEEIIGFLKQLEMNKNPGEPRENTTPVTPPDSSELGSPEQEVVVPEEMKNYGKNTDELKRIFAGSVEPAAPSRPTVSSSVYSTASRPEPTVSVAPKATAIRLELTTARPGQVVQRPAHGVIHPRRIPPPRAIPTPRPVVAGVAQQKFSKVIPASQHLAPQQIVHQPQPQQQQQYNYQNQQQQNSYHQQPQNQQHYQQQQQQQPQIQQQPHQIYTQHYEQYQQYLRQYYPAYAQPQQQQQQFYYPTQTAQPPRQFPLAHPYGQGVLVTNQQPQPLVQPQGQYAGK